LVDLVGLGVELCKVFALGDAVGVGAFVTVEEVVVGWHCE
jgi:hypothetical protein